MSQIISHFVLTLIICAGLATKRKYQCAETMKLRTACVNIVDVSRYFLQFPIIRLRLTHCLSSSDDSHFEMKQSKLWSSKGALGFLIDGKGIFIFSFSQMSLSITRKSHLLCACIFHVSWVYSEHSAQQMAGDLKLHDMSFIKGQSGP